jgi:DNA polymerase-1
MALPGLDGPNEASSPEPQPPNSERTSSEQPAAPSGAESTVADQSGEEATESGSGVVYVLDTHALLFQVFHALPEMTSPSGEPVGAVFGIVRDLLHILEEKKPEFLFAAFDLPGPTFRHDIYQAYKADREAMPESLASQIPKVRQVLEALGVPVLASEGYEADDVLATVARLCTEQQRRCLLVTSDKDCRQLINEWVQVYNVRKDEIYDAKSLEKDWGIRPDQVVDFQSLVGDKVDNVPGVPLIGPKVARDWLSEYGTLDNLLANAEKLKKGKRRENLIAGRDDALMSRNLVRLDDRVEIEIDWETGRVGEFDRIHSAELFAQFGFRGFTRKMSESATADTPAEWVADYQTVDTPGELAELVEQLSKQKQISIDTETTHVWPRWAELVGLSFAFEAGKAWYVPVRGPAGERVLDLEPTLDALRPVLTDSSIGKIGQNLKYDIIVLRNHGVELAGVAFDTMVASYLLDAGQRNHGMDELSRRFLNHAPIPIKDLIGSGRDQKRMDEVPIAQISPYAAEDADIPVRLHTILAQRLAEDELDTLMADVEAPLIEVLAELEFNGIRLDTALLKKLSDQYAERLTILESEIYELAGCELNIASPKQLAQVLFEKHELPVLKKTKTGPSTDAEVLEQLARLHPLPAKIIEFRQFSKLKSTYVDALPKMVHPETQRVHASFNQVVAATGRLSSHDPNLQNIPVRTEHGREIRSAFLPAEGWKLLAADYSQIELRVLAHFCGDEALREAFERDEDIHSRVAGEVHGVAVAEVTPEMRRSAKAVNFGVIYGQTAFGLAAALDIEQEKAAEFIEAYFKRYPGVEGFIAKTLAECRQNGYVKTVLGRRRAISGVREEPARWRNLPERTAINTVIQGSAADLMKLAMIHIHRRLKQEQRAARMLLQIHDELIFEVPPEELKYLAELVAEEMAGVIKLDVPLRVDLKSGDNWADCEPW